MTKKSKHSKIALIPEQLLLFEDPIEDRLLRKVKELEEALERNRKALHAKHGSLQKIVNDLQTDMEYIKTGICKATLQEKNKCQIFELALL